MLSKNDDDDDCRKRKKQEKAGNEVTLVLKLIKCVPPPFARFNLEIA